MNEDPTETGFHRAFKRRLPQAVWILPFLHYATPALVGAALTALGGGLVYVFNSPQKDIHRVQEIIAQQQVHEQKTDELLQQLVTGQAVMNAAMSDFRDEQDRQREWRDRLADIAETPPHARRRPK